MAVKGSGTGTAGPDKGAFTEQTHYDARKGAAKKPQTDFPVKGGMKDQNAPSGVTSAIAPIHPGVGPDGPSCAAMGKTLTTTILSMLSSLLSLSAARSRYAILSLRSSMLSVILPPVLHPLQSQP